MTKIIFKNLEKSELAKQISLERLETVFNKFPDLEPNNITLTLAMDNSPKQSGQDVFRLKFVISKGKYKGIIIEKSSSNLYLALAQLVEHLLEAINRYGDKARIIRLKQKRLLKTKELPV